jgi:hypothetical protein
VEEDFAVMLARSLVRREMIDHVTNPPSPFPQFASVRLETKIDTAPPYLLLQMDLVVFTLQ